MGSRLLPPAMWLCLQSAGGCYLSYAADADIGRDADAGRDVDARRDSDGDLDGESCPDGPSGRALLVTNRTTASQYVNLELPLEFFFLRPEGWQAFVPEHGCATVCAPECTPNFCEPCDPAVQTVPVGDTMTVSWDGRMYPAGEDLQCEWVTDGTSTLVPCLRELEAPAGRYKVRLCHSPEYIPEPSEFGPCWEGEGIVSPASLAAPVCPEVEFDYRPCESGTVEVPMRP